MGQFNTKQPVVSRINQEGGLEFVMGDKVVRTKLKASEVMFWEVIPISNSDVRILINTGSGVKEFRFE